MLFTFTLLCVPLAARAAGLTTTLPAWLFLAGILVALVRVDLREHRLPDRLVLAGLAGGGALLALASAHHPQRLVRAALASGATGAAMITLALAVPGGLGLGDAKLAALLGGYLGWQGWGQVLCGLGTGFALGGAGALALLATRRAQWCSEIAFGPALCLGALAVAARHGPPMVPV